MRHAPTRVVPGLLAVLALLLTGLVGAAPAQAASTITFTPSGGAVGKAIQLTSSVSSGALGVAAGTVAYFASGVKVAQAAVNTTGAAAAASWTPSTAGSIPMYAQYTSTDGIQTATSAVVSVTIAKAPTTTTTTAPTTAKVGATVTFTATVAAGSYVPTGSVSFILPDGTLLASPAVNASGVASLTVQMPAQPATYRLRARYNGDANAAGSTSTAASVLVTTSGSPVALSVSAGPYIVGAAVTLTATVSPSGAAGSVTFAAGTTVIGATKVSAGKASITWKPTAAGAVTLTAGFIPEGSTSISGTDSVQITAVTNLPPNAIIIGPSGQPAWAATQGYAMRFGDSVQLTATSASGAPVTLSITGPCGIAGPTLTASAGAGTCTLTAAAPATASFTASTRTTTISLARGVQTATLTPPSPRKLVRGTAYRLASPGTKTNAGATVVWSVTKGKSRCTVATSGDGTVLLRTFRKGTCKVRAFAPPVTGQWLKFQKSFRYRVR